MNKMLEIIGTTPFDGEDIKAAGLLFFKKLLAANTYRPAGKFSGTVRLIKAADSFMSLGHDYGLSEVSLFYLFNYLSFSILKRRKIN